MRKQIKVVVKTHIRLEYDPENTLFKQKMHEMGLTEEELLHVVTVRLSRNDKTHFIRGIGGINRIDAYTGEKVVLHPKEDTGITFFGYYSDFETQIIK